MLLMELVDRIAVVFVPSRDVSAKANSPPTFDTLNEDGIVTLSVVWPDSGFLSGLSSAR